MKAFYLMICALFILITLPSAVYSDQTNDEKLTEIVTREISEDYQINDLFFTVKVENKEVILDGRALSQEDKDLAEKIAGEVKGVKGVRNNLEIKPLTKDDVEALELMRLKARAGKPSAADRGLSVADETPSYIKKDELESQTAYEESLRDMDQSLNRNIEAGYSDREIKQAVEEAILRAPLRGRSDNITVMVQNGYVTLLGTVNNIMDQQTIRDAAASVPGVRSVSDSTNLNR
ncbi:BON domain-containing protein [Candidatus Auribacterota bacterium]